MTDCPPSSAGALGNNFDERNHYEVLGISPNASTEEIKRAYKKCILEHHPDKNAEDAQGSTRRFTRIQEAYETLIDDQKRTHYDQRHARHQPHYTPPSSSYDYDVHLYPSSLRPFFLFTSPSYTHGLSASDEWPFPWSGTARLRAQRSSPFPSPTFQNIGRNYFWRRPTNPYECLEDDLQEFLT